MLCAVCVGSSSTTNRHHGSSALRNAVTSAAIGVHEQPQREARSICGGTPTYPVNLAQLSLHQFTALSSNLSSICLCTVYLLYGFDTPLTLGTIKCDSSTSMNTRLNSRAHALLSQCHLLNDQHLRARTPAPLQLLQVYF
jgi:hypothetical protein